MVTRTLAAGKVPDWDAFLSNQTFTNLNDSFTKKFAQAARNHQSRLEAGTRRRARGFGEQDEADPKDDWHDDKVEAYSLEGGEEILDNWSSSSFFHTISLAYSRHLPLKLSPDDLWITITSGIARHINFADNAEKYRKKFVTHEGQQDISVLVDKHLSSDSVLQQNNVKVLGWNLKWPACINDVVVQIQKRTLPTITEKMVADFTTTTPAAHTASQIVVMESMKKYFSYKMVMLCGIPEIRLEGTERDWTRLIEKTNDLKALDIGLNDWLDGVLPILDKFLQTYRGQVDEDFWSKIMTSKRYGSGGQRQYTGWIIKLFPYDSDGRLIQGSLPNGDEPTSFVKCPFVMNDNGDEWDMHLYAGHLGIGLDKGPDGKPECLSPKLSWMVVRRGRKAGGGYAQT